MSVEKEDLVKPRPLISEHARLIPRERLGAHANLELSTGQRIAIPAAEHDAIIRCAIVAQKSRG